MTSNLDKAIRASNWSILGNFVLAVIKGLAGFFGSSFALIADALESLTDVLSSTLVLFGFKYAKRPADDNHPYGHGKIEPIITFIVVLLIILSAIFIGYQSILNINTPHELPESWTLVVVGGIIIWKEISYRMMLKKAKETKSTSLKADAWHHRSDAITSLAALVGISLALWLGEGYENLDDWAALLAAIFLIYNAFIIFRPALSEMMDEHVYDELVQQIKDFSVTIEGVKDTEKCFVRKAGMDFHVELHLIVEGSISVREGHTIAHLLKDALKEEFPELDHILIHVEPTN